MTGTNKSARTLFSIVLTVALICLMTAAIIPGVMGVAVGAVDLGKAGNFSILVKSGITNVHPAAITGDVGNSPDNGADIAVYCSEITGKIYGVDALYVGDGVDISCYHGTAPDKTLVDTAVLDMGTAYADAAGKPAGVGPFLNVGAGTLTDQTLVPGVYTWGTGVTIPTNLTLDGMGNSSAVWIFQISGTLGISANKHVILINGSQARNIFWQVTGATTLLPGSVFEGTILDATNIALQTGATLHGRALAQTAVTLQMNTVTIPAAIPPINPTTTVVYSSLNPSMWSQPVTFTAIVNGSAGTTGENVTFRDNGTTWSGSSNIQLNSTGAVQVTKSDLTVGSHNITARYNGNSTMTASMGSVNPQTVTGGKRTSPVNLGSAGNYVILAKSGITTTGTTNITGNIGVSPIAATAITGFGPTMDASGQFSTSPLVLGGGRIYAADYAVPTPATLTTAVSNMETAYTDAAGLPPDIIGLGAGDLSGLTLPPGIYKWSTGVLISTATDLTLDAQGNGNAVWIFQVAQDLTMQTGSRVLLTNGAKAGNIYWQIGGPTGVTIGPGAHAEGNILAAKAITMNSGASLNGSALAQTTVTLIGNTIRPPEPTPDFTYPPITRTAPLDIIFTDASASAVPIVSWFWDFGDGFSSTEVNPTHTYANVGTYVVNHTVTNILGNWSSTYETITILAAGQSFGSDSGGGGGVAPSGPATAPAAVGAPAAQPATFLIAQEGQTLATNTVSTPSDATVEASVTIEQGTTITGPTGNFVNSISVSQVNVQDVPSMPAGAGFSFSGYAVQCGPDGVTFSEPVSLTFSLTPAQWNDALAQANGNPALMEIQFYDKVTQSWVALPTTVNAATHEVTALVDHFSLFALVIVQAPTTTPAAAVPTTPRVSVTTVPPTIPAKTPTTTQPTPTPFVSIPAMIGVLVVAGLAYSLARKR